MLWVLSLDITISFAAGSSLADTMVKPIMKQCANIEDMWDVNGIKVQTMSDLQMTPNAIGRKLKMHPKSVSKILQQIRRSVLRKSAPQMEDIFNTKK